MNAMSAYERINERFERLDMRLVRKPLDLNGRRHAFGSYRLNDLGQSFYSTLENAEAHAAEIERMRALLSQDPAS